MKTSGFLTFSGGIEIEHWHELGAKTALFYIEINRNSRSQMLFKIDVLKNVSILDVFL